MRKIVAKMIRRVTGVPYGAANQLARRFVAGNSLWDWEFRNPAHKFIDVDSLCPDFGCCGGDYANAFIHGPKGKVTREEIRANLETIKRLAERATAYQKERSALKATRRQKANDRAPNRPPKPGVTYLGPSLIRPIRTGSEYQAEPKEELDSQAEYWLALATGNWP